MEHKLSWGQVRDTEWSAHIPIGQVELHVEKHDIVISFGKIKNCHVLSALN